MARAKVDRFTRIVMLVWLVAGLILITVAVRAVRALGVVSWAEPVTPGICRAIALPGVADLAYDFKSRNLFAVAAGGLYTLPLGANKPVKLAGTPADFHPQALSVGYNANGAPSLMAVDHKKSGAFAVENYTLAFDGQGAPHLSYESSIQGGLVSRPSGIAALGDARFYLAVDPARSGFVAWVNRWLVLPRAAVLFFNGTLFRSSINDVSDPSAVAVSSDRRHLLIASRTERRVVGFSMDPYSGALAEVGSLSLPLRPERMGFDTNGALWVAGPARPPELFGATSSRVVRVTMDGEGKPVGQQTVWADDGKTVAGAMAVARGEGHLYIASPADGRLLDCAVK